MKEGERGREHMIQFTCAPTDLLITLKNQVFKEYYCFPEDVGIYLHGRELDSDKTMRNLGIDEGARVEVRINQRVLSEFIEDSDEIEGKEGQLRSKELIMDRLKKRMARYSEIGSYKDIAELGSDIENLRETIRELQSEISDLKRDRERKKDKLTDAIARTRRAMVKRAR